VATTAERLTGIEGRLVRLDTRLEKLNLNGSVDALVELAKKSPNLLELADKAPVLVELAANEAVLRDMIDHRTEQKKLQDAKDYVEAHARLEFMKRFGKPLRIAKWTAPFLAGAAAFRLMTWIDPSPILHFLGGH